MGAMLYTIIKNGHLVNDYQVAKYFLFVFILDHLQKLGLCSERINDIETMVKFLWNQA